MKLSSFLGWVLLGLLFAINYKQYPLYTSNQNTKFLHGAAASQHGYLTNDWLAGTIDPLLLFSTLIEWLYRIGNIELSYVIFVFLLVVYIYALFGIARHIYPLELERGGTALYLFTAFFFIAHIVRYFLYSGLAGQSLVGHVLEPSVFGVFLLLSIYRFLKKDFFWAAIWLVVAVNFHSAYLLTALLLQSLYFAVALWRRLGIRETVVPAVLFVLLSTPMVIHSVVVFSPTTVQVRDPEGLLISINSYSALRTDFRWGLPAYLLAFIFDSPCFFCSSPA